MCDYSLMSFPNRLAVEKEELITHRFPSGSIGLASVDDVRRQELKRTFWTTIKNFFNPDLCSIPAVCVPPAARLAIHDLPRKMQIQYGLNSEEEAVFEELSTEEHMYRDALYFQNGVHVRLQEAPVGLRISVVDLGFRDSTAPAGNKSLELLGQA
jgi:hypothetical protein